MSAIRNRVRGFTIAASVLALVLTTGFLSRRSHAFSITGQQHRTPITCTIKTRVSSKLPSSVSRKTRLFASTIPTDRGQQNGSHLHGPNRLEKGESPAIVFGQPIDERTKELNRKFIHHVKAFLFDVVFSGSDVEHAYARFYALETIARMPYFSYLCVLHLFETLGSWRKAEYLRIHFAETWNEMHHLLIMEELGGNKKFAHRFIAQHCAFMYFWMVVALYLFNPTLAYNLNQAVEEEAYETYDRFIKKHEEYLKSRPAPEIAVKYYTGEDLYLFDEMHTIMMDEQQKRGFLDVLKPVGTGINHYHDDGGGGGRRPVCETLYDCFCAIRDDEWEHVKTMKCMQDDCT